MLGFIIASVLSLGLGSTVPFGFHTSIIDVTETSVSMAVMWSTNVSSAGFCQYAVHGSGTFSRVGSTQANYLTGSVFLHTAILRDLQPLTDYDYSCGVPPSGPLSKTFTVRTTAAAGATTPLHVVMFGDMGTNDPARQTVARLVADATGNSALRLADIYYSLGDHSYADDRPVGDGIPYEVTYDRFIDQWESLASRRPLQVLPGNHDVTCHSYGKFFCPDGLDNFTAFVNRFRMPQYEMSKNTYWSMDVGPVHFVAINTEADLPNIGDGPEGHHSMYLAGGFGPQLGWLRADLQKAAANREKVPWIIVTGHRPIFTAKVLDWPLGLQFYQREFLQPLFQEFGVDAYITGHIHGYERHWPIKDATKTGENYTNPDGVVYVVCGASGNIEGHEGFSKIYNESWMNVRNNQDYGVISADFFNATTAQFQFVTQNGKVVDSFTLVKNRK